MNKSALKPQLSTTELVEAHSDENLSSDLCTCTPGRSNKLQLQIIKKNWKKGLEIAILSAIILAVWILFSMPTILYALSPLNSKHEVNEN